MKRSLPERGVRHSRARVHRRRAGFSLIELLVVVSVIMILIALIAPQLRSVKEGAWQTQCSSQLHQIHQAMMGIKTDGSAHTGIPDAWQWTTAVQLHGAGDAMLCPKGRFDEDVNYDNAYFVQKDPNPRFSYVDDIKAGNLHVQDPQIGRLWKGSAAGDFGESGEGWPPWAYEQGTGQLYNPQDMAVTFNDDAGAMVEYSKIPARVVSLNPPDSKHDGLFPGNTGGDTSCSSDHWFCIGEGGDEWEQDIVMRLTGNGYQNKVDPPTNLGAASYGMNAQVDGKNARAGQILLMDYKKSVIDILPSGNNIHDFDEFFAPRHFDQSNVMTVNGGVRAMHRTELDDTNPMWYEDPEDALLVN